MTAKISLWDLRDQVKRQEAVETMSRYGRPEQLRDRGISLALGNANTDWKRAAAKRLQHLIATRESFTSDDILVYLDEQGIVTGNTTAIGGIVRAACTAGQIEPGEYVASKHTKSHGRPKRLWRVIRRGV